VIRPFAHAPAVALALALALTAFALAGEASPALAAPARTTIRPDSGILCKAAGLISGLAGTVCKVATHPKTVITVGKKLLSGDPGGVVKAILGTSSGAGRAVAAAAGLAAVVTWVTGGARAALHATAKLIGSSSSPNLLGTWFSRAYWQVAAVSALLTLPFLFAAAIQALLRSDMTLLARAAFGYLPLGMLAVGVAAPLTMLLLSASDEMSTIVASASGHADGSFLAHAGLAAGAVGGAAISPFVAFFVALLTVAATITLWLELLIREAAVYVVVLMLPLFFAALVWPARRVWAVRAVELLVALILSKFAIVAVLALGGAALDHAAALSVTSLLAGLTLVLLAAFSPWALLRLLPLHEMAGAAAGGLRTASAQPLFDSAERGTQLARSASEHREAMERWLLETAARRSPRDDVRAQTADTTGAPSQPVAQERVETAAEEAATAVAASGGPSAGSPGSAGSPPALPGSAGSPPATAETGQPPPTAAEPDDDRHLTARGADTLPERWHRDWEPFHLGEGMDVNRAVGGAATEAPGPAAAGIDPPTLPDAAPRPPARRPGEDAR
jgi:hypothetical protein